MSTAIDLLAIAVMVIQYLIIVYLSRKIRVLRKAGEAMTAIAFRLARRDPDLMQNEILKYFGEFRR